MILKYSIVALSFILAACSSNGQPTSTSKTNSEARQQVNAKTSTEVTKGENLENAVNSVVISGGLEKLFAA
jgi:hypothetical protein